MNLLLNGKRKRINKPDSKVAEYFEFCMFFFISVWFFIIFFFQMLKQKKQDCCDNNPASTVYNEPVLYLLPLEPNIGLLPPPDGLLPLITLEFTPNPGFGPPPPCGFGPLPNPWLPCPL